MSINLSPRLQTVAEFVREGSIVADIGTDHAYLPIYLVQKGIAEHVYACDIKQGPLDNARACISRYLSDDSRIDLMLTDGIQGVPECGVYVMAGMGGETICGILDRAPDLSFFRGRDVILQPMTARDDLRKYLYTNGFHIADERVCIEPPGKFYCVIRAVYTGVSTDFTIEDLYFSDALRRRIGEPEAADYCFYLMSVTEKAISGMKKSSAPDKRALEKYEALYRGLRGIYYENNGE